jgi:hypothetical protein
VILDALTPDAYQEALAELNRWRMEEQALVERCQQAARRWFDLESVGGPAYVRVYQSLSRSAERLTVTTPSLGAPREVERLP